jgi:hypothetical protein
MSKKSKPINDIEVSTFEGLGQRTPRPTNLLHHLEKKMDDMQHKKLVEEIASKTDAVERKKLKKMLPSIVASYRMVGGKTAAHIVEVLPIGNIDIDCGSKETAAKCFNDLKKYFSETAIYIEYSASMQGVHMLVFLEDSDNLLEHQQALYEEIGKLGYEVDKSSFNKTQQMFLGHTYSAFLNKEPVPYKKRIKLEKKADRQKEIKDVDKVKAKLEIYIAEIEKKEVDITSEYKNWVKLGFALAHFGEDGREYFHRISKLNPNYSVENTDKQYSLCLGDYSSSKIKLGTFYWHCHNNGIKPVIKKEKEEEQKKSKQQIYLEKIEEFLERYIFRFNLVLNRTEIMNPDTDEFIPVENRDLSSMFRKAWKNSSKVPEKTLKTLLESDLVPLYHPFLDYFNNLPKWDGKDYVGDLLATVKTDNDKLWEKYVTRWLVALVGSAMVDKVVNHQCLVLIGAQGIGKTSWVNKLIPKQLEKYVYHGSVNPNNKDTLIQVSETFLINLDEFESLNKSEIGALKNLITVPNIRLRKPYGYYFDHLPHRCSFVATVNEAQIFRDTTGSRRWLAFEAEKIDYNHNINMDMVYSQLVQMFRDGVKYWIDGEEKKELEAHNEQFVNKTMEEELLLYFFRPCKRDEASVFWNTTKIMEHIASHTSNFTCSNNVKNNLGRALRKNDFLRLKKKGVYVYALQEIPESEHAQEEINRQKWKEQQEKQAEDKDEDSAVYDEFGQLIGYKETTIRYVRPDEDKEKEKKKDSGRDKHGEDEDNFEFPPIEIG